MTTPDTAFHRLPARGRSDRETIDAILDEGLVAHAGLVEDGHPIVIPVAYARDGDTVLIHGSPASRMLRSKGPSRLTTDRQSPRRAAGPASIRANTGAKARSKRLLLPLSRIAASRLSTCFDSMVSPTNAALAP